MRSILSCEVIYSFYYICERFFFKDFYLSKNIKHVTSVDYRLGYSLQEAKQRLIPSTNSLWCLLARHPNSAQQLSAYSRGTSLLAIRESTINLFSNVQKGSLYSADSIQSLTKVITIILGSLHKRNYLMISMKPYKFTMCEGQRI